MATAPSGRPQDQEFPNESRSSRLTMTKTARKRVDHDFNFMIDAGWVGLLGGVLVVAGERGPQALLLLGPALPTGHDLLGHLLPPGPQQEVRQRQRHQQGDEQ